MSTTTCVRRVTAPRVLLALAAAVLCWAALSQAHPAGAYAEWCFDDPIVAVNGHLVDLRVGQPAANLLTMRSTALTVIIPQNVAGSVVVNNVSAFPMTTTISRTGKAWSGRGAIPVTVVATVTAGVRYPVQLLATPLLTLTTPLGPIYTASGTTNQSFRLSFTLG